METQPPPPAHAPSHLPAHLVGPTLLSAIESPAPDADVSARIPDWSREDVRKFFDPSRQLLRHIRRYQHWQSHGGALRWLFQRWHVAWYRFWSLATGAEIDLRAQIGGGLLLPHPNGIVIHPDAVIGPNCLLFQQVTLGTGGRFAGCPRLGGHVDVGAGAKLLGGITIGDDARIGANAVVLDDVPSAATAVGIPARVIAQPPIDGDRPLCNNRA